MVRKSFICNLSHVSNPYHKAVIFSTLSLYYHYHKEFADLYAGVAGNTPMLCAHAALVARWNSKAKPQTCHGYEYYLCSSQCHVPFTVLWDRGREYMRLLTWQLRRSNEASLSARTQSPGCSEERARLERRRVRGGDNHTIPAFTLSSLSWPNYTSDLPLHHSRSCFAVCMRQIHTTPTAHKNIVIQSLVGVLV